MPLMDGFEEKKWSASPALSIAALGARPRKANSQPHFHICALRAQSLPQLRPGSEQQSCDAASSTIFRG
jgi:hypothetical protein